MNTVRQCNGIVVVVEGHARFCLHACVFAADAFYTIVDMHAITVEHDPKELREATRSTAALYLASGVDPSKVRQPSPMGGRTHEFPGQMDAVLTCLLPSLGFGFCFCCLF